MLKLTYIETGFNLERLAQSLEEWVHSRVILALRVRQKLLIEPSTASFLLPADLSGLTLLKAGVQQETTDVIAVCVCDAEYVEISLRGTWMAAAPESVEGVFVAAMSDRTEFLVFKLWQDSACTSSLKQ